jgi:hypothetical protein
VGPGLGDYDPVILLPLPQIRRYGSLGSRWNSGDSALTLEAELAGSRFDKNTLSNIDGPEPGVSGAARANYSRSLFNNDGFIGLDANFRSIGTDAIFPGRIDGIERYRDYDLAPDLDPGGEKLREFRLEAGMDPGRRVDLGMGLLSHPDLADRKRYLGSASWRFMDRYSVLGRAERTSGERVWWKRSVGLSAGYEPVQPSFRIDYESRDGENGFKYYEYLLALPATYYGGVTGSTELDFRDEKYLDVIWKDKFRSGSIRQKISLTGRSGFSGQLEGSYYRKKYRDFAGTDSEQKTGWTRLTYSDPGGKGTLFISERLSSSSERLQAKNYIAVEPGDGEYRLEDGEYIRDPEGDYILVIEELGEGSRITEVSTEINGSVSPLAVIDPQRNLESSVGRISLESELTYRLKKASDVLIGRDFVPWRTDDPGQAVLRSGRWDFRIFFYPRNGGQRIKYAGTRSYQDGSPFVNETVSERSRSDGLSWAFSIAGRADVLLSTTISKRSRSSGGAGFEISGHEETASADYRFSEFWILKAGLGFEVAEQTDLDIRSTIPSVELGLTREFMKAGRASVNLSYFRMLVNPEGSYIPYQVASGKSEGDNFLAGARTRLEVYKNGRLDFSYRYENFSRRPERHNLKVEFTILFQ